MGFPRAGFGLKVFRRDRSSPAPEKARLPSPSRFPKSKREHALRHAPRIIQRSSFGGEL
jgi:hypothetical protein